MNRIKVYTESKQISEFEHNLYIIEIIFLIFSFFFAVASFAQSGNRGQRSGGWGMGNQYDRLFNPKTVEVFYGDVISIEKIIPIKGMFTGVHLIVKASNENISIHLGPEWFIEKQEMEILPKDHIVIKGSRITYEGKPAIIASEIIKGDEILLLRNDTGIPVWSSWRQKR